MRYYIVCYILCFKAGVLAAQSYTQLTVADFLNAVSVHPEITRQTDDIALAQLNVEIARVSPDPVLGFGNASGDISGINMPHQLFIGIEHTIETGRKRRHRINYARQQIAVAREEHTAFVNTFKRDALLAFQECWTLEQQIREL
jgi:cobalt-zinc-cadmium efflux system outer membrane protein